MRPMITNGGPHPADKWADVTAEAITDLLVDINPDSVTPEALAARQAKRDLAPKLFAIFNDHHDAVQKHEQGNLTKNIKAADHAAIHAAGAINPRPHVLSTMEQVNAALAATPFAAHFAQPHVQTILHSIVGQHTADVMHIERRWHADRLGA